MDAGGKAPKVGAIGDAWSSCREGRVRERFKVGKMHYFDPCGNGA